MASRSGYVVEVPLGMWSSVEFAFFEESGGSGNIDYVEAHLTDESGVFDLPNQLREFAAQYMKTWLATPTRRPDGALEFTPVAWVGNDHWQAQTAQRLRSLWESGAGVQYREDLDD